MDKKDKKPRNKKKQIIQRRESIRNKKVKKFVIAKDWLFQETQRVLMSIFYIPALSQKYLFLL